MDVLFLQLEQLQAAVGVVAQLHAVRFKEFGDDLVAQSAQIARHDEIVVIGGTACVLKVSFQCIVGGGSHGRPHVVGVLDALVLNFTDSDTVNLRAFTRLGSEYNGTGRGGGPLGGGGALAAVLQRGAVLPLRRAEVGRGHGGGIGAVPAGQQQGGQCQTFSHGGAGAVQSQKGDSALPCCERGADALVEQVARQHEVQIHRVQTGPLQCRVQSQLLHGALRLFPALFPELIVFADMVKTAAQRAFRFFAAARGAVPQNGGRVREPKTLLSQFQSVHGNLPRNVFRSLPETGKNMLTR